MTLAMSTTGRSSLKRSNGGALLDQVATVAPSPQNCICFADLSCEPHQHVSAYVPRATTTDACAVTCTGQPVITLRYI